MTENVAIALARFNQLHEMYIYINIEITYTMLVGGIYTNLDISSDYLNKHFKYIECT